MQEDDAVALRWDPSDGPQLGSCDRVFEDGERAHAPRIRHSGVELAESLVHRAEIGARLELAVGHWWLETDDLGIVVERALVVGFVLLLERVERAARDRDLGGLFRAADGLEATGVVG